MFHAFTRMPGESYIVHSGLCCLLVLHILRGCTSGGVYVPCIHMFAR